MKKTIGILAILALLIVALSSTGLAQGIDSDRDGLTDFDEIVIYHTNPFNPDTDFGGMWDGEEVIFCDNDPHNPNDDRVC